MSLYRPLLLALTATSLIATPALAAPHRASSSLVATGLGMAGFDDRRPRDQDRAFRATREGRSMPLPMIERRVRPHMNGADYFLETIATRETELIKRLFSAHPAPFEILP